RAWGEKCAERLEGDFAFILHDAEAGRVVCARSFSGKRPLYYAEPSGSLVVASALSAVLAHPWCPTALNMVSIAECAAGLSPTTSETSYEAVRRVPAGSSLVWAVGSAPRLPRHWEPPPFVEAAAASFEEAAQELREIIRLAVTERLDTSGPTSVWLSGGWDSPAVFASGENELKRRGRGEHLRPVSISYPVGDSGREDELILDIVQHWGAPVHWLDIGNIPLFQDTVRTAASREEPFAHAFEFWNRALVAGSRAEGARVAFDGVGADQIFQVSPVYIADLVRGGRWIHAAREWRARGMSGSGFRRFFRMTIQPLLPSAALALASAVRGRPLVSYFDRHLPPWIRTDFARRYQLAERHRARVDRFAGGSQAAYEAHWFLTEPFFPEVFRMVAGFALEDGLELRSPLYDNRVIGFAATRPRDERAKGGETKRLLRAAMRGLIPANVLAPRPYHTGTTGEYFWRSMRESFPPLLEAALDNSVLVDAGIVDGEVLRRVAGPALQGSQNVALNLFYTVQTELWLRELIRSEKAVESEHPPQAATATARC
ncbi:MAG: asparagine synthase-related protein, partial [Gemmatimonadaceae bacterium]